MEAIRRYKNAAGLADDLARATGRILGAKPSRRCDTDTPAASPHGRRFTLDQLTDCQVTELVKCFDAGTPKTLLAREYGISLSSVKRVLRRSRHS